MWESIFATICWTHVLVTVCMSQLLSTFPSIRFVVVYEARRFFSRILGYSNWSIESRSVSLTLMLSPPISRILCTCPSSPSIYGVECELLCIFNAFICKPNHIQPVHCWSSTSNGFVCPLHSLFTSFAQFPPVSAIDVNIMNESNTKWKWPKWGRLNRCNRPLSSSKRMQNWFCQNCKLHRQISQWVFGNAKIMFTIGKTHFPYGVRRSM